MTSLAASESYLRKLLGALISLSYMIGSSSSFTAIPVVKQLPYCHSSEVSALKVHWLSSSYRSHGHGSFGPLLAKRRKKESMAEKRARRQAKQQRQVEKMESPGDVTTMTTPAQEQAQQQQQEAHASASNSANTQAQELLDRQRESINVLSTIRKAVENIDEQELSDALSGNGYFVVDDFLSDQGLLDKLQMEATVLYDGNATTLDTSETALGFSGEFVTQLKGGEDQYQIAPRSIEWVVGVTKYMPSKLKELDSANCMAFLRTYDADARNAARALFFGEQKEGDDSDATTETPDEEPTCTDYADEAPDESDLRYLSLRYYMVNQDWDSSAGGIRFESTPKVTIEAKADRLVLYKSKGTKIQKDAWFLGNNGLNRGNCIELHLLKATEETTDA